MADNFGSKFWANITSEPKRKYRFILELAGIDAWVITKVDRPSFTVSETEHAYYNHKFYYPGRVEWQTVSFSLVDPISPDATAYIMGMLGACGYQIPTPFQYQSISKEASVNILGEVKIKAKNAEGANVEIWTLKNAWVKNATMSDFDYTSEDMLTMDIELRYDYALFNSVDGGGAALSIQSAGVKSKGNTGISIQDGYNSLKNEAV
jgi:1,2-phenylacetyl-CoA epoxidase PaaB subunit